MKRFDKPKGLCLSCCGGDDLSCGGDSATPLPQWSYSGPTGPEHWGDLDPRYAAAKTGRQQSPIDLTGPFETGAETAFFTYQASPLSVENNGHSIQVNCPQGSSVSVGGRRYDLIQYHFHTPSEHTVDGGFYEMEVHLVHQGAHGQFMVVGAFMTKGNTHLALDEIWKYMPESAGDSVENDVLVDPTDFLPTDRRLVQYDGSLTTPPCTEGVGWIMMLEPIHVSAEQIQQFERVIGPSNRPVQPLNDRVLRAGP